MKTVEELKAKKKEIERHIMPFIEQFEREFECQVQGIDTVRVESAAHDGDSILVDLSLNVKI